MYAYWVKTPRWLSRFFPDELIWRMPEEKEPSVYLTFDDGPHPEATVFVLDELKKYKAKATFFCVGRNVSAYGNIYERILEEGHTTGNHTEDHVNGWRNNRHNYLKNIFSAGKHIQSRNFRPPYGRIKFSQVKRLSRNSQPWKIFMWDVLSGDFDQDITPQQCLQNVLQHMEPGSIVVFHDSEKAMERMTYALPLVLQFCQEKKWQVKALPKY